MESTSIESPTDHADHVEPRPGLALNGAAQATAGGIRVWSRDGAEHASAIVERALEAATGRERRFREAFLSRPLRGRRRAKQNRQFTPPRIELSEETYVFTRDATIAGRAGGRAPLGVRLLAAAMLKRARGDLELLGRYERGERIGASGRPRSDGVEGTRFDGWTPTEGRRARRWLDRPGDPETPFTAAWCVAVLGGWLRSEAAR